MKSVKQTAAKESRDGYPWKVDHRGSFGSSPPNIPRSSAACRSYTRASSTSANRRVARIGLEAYVRSRLLGRRLRLRLRLRREAWHRHVHGQRVERLPNQKRAVRTQIRK